MVQGSHQLPLHVQICLFLFHQLLQVRTLTRFHLELTFVPKISHISSFQLKILRIQILAVPFIAFLFVNLHLNSLQDVVGLQLLLTCRLDVFYCYWLETSTYCFSHFLYPEFLSIESDHRSLFALTNNLLQIEFGLGKRVQIFRHFARFQLG